MPSFFFQTSVLCEGLEKGTMVISQTDGYGRSHLAYCKCVIFGDKDQDGNRSSLLPLRALYAPIILFH